MEKAWNILFKHKSKEETIKENTDLLKIKEVSTLKKKVLEDRAKTATEVQCLPMPRILTDAGGGPADKLTGGALGVTSC